MARRREQQRDEDTLRFRELLVSNGLDGDRCPVLYAPEITEAALDRLVIALDEHVDGRELRGPSLRRSRDTRSIAFPRDEEAIGAR